MKLNVTSIQYSIFIISSIFNFGTNAFTTVSTLQTFNKKTSFSYLSSPSTTTSTTLNHHGEEAAPFSANAITIAGAIHSLSGQTIVIKYGGNAMTSPELAKGFCEDIAALQKIRSSCCGCTWWRTTNC